MTQKIKPVPPLDSSKKVVTLMLEVEYEMDAYTNAGDILEQAKELVDTARSYGAIRVAKLSPIGEVDLK
jgi:hypothetical protein